MNDHETDTEHLAGALGALVIIILLAAITLSGFQKMPRAIADASDRSGGEVVHTRPLVEDGYMLPSAFAPIGSVQIPGTGMSYGGF